MKQLISGADSLQVILLQRAIEKKYSPIFELSDNHIEVKDSVKDFLLWQSISAEGKPCSSDQSTISMTISINNLQKDHCACFLWEVAQRAIGDKFKFDFNVAAAKATAQLIRVDMSEAHHTIVRHAFDYLIGKPTEEQDEKGLHNISKYLTQSLPFHLGELHVLEIEAKRDLTSLE